MNNPEVHLQKWQRKAAFREYCKQDVVLDLTKKKLSSKDINKILEKLEQDNFINEKRYAQAFFNDHINIQRWGPLKINQKLYEKKIPGNYIQKLNELMDLEKVQSNCRELASKKISFENFVLPLNHNDKAKLVRYLQQKGYPMDTLYKVIENIK